ncbi:MAG: threonine synthase [Planctomycetes bacterium]|nr:threonine synthase [Planctomycetota bacterium]
MIVRSTRGASEATLSEAIGLGLAPDGGLFMPPVIPPRGTPWPETLVETAEALLAPLVQDDPLGPHLRACVHEAFSFEAPTRWLDGRTGLLELFHGPTAAFKDFGARFLAAVMRRMPSSIPVRTVLVATSGDTGAAVASAFHAQPGFRVVILYPDGRVSPRQAHQLGAFGENVRAFRVAGTFDDCQRLVKGALADASLVRAHGLVSANSISLGRLLPQMAYYALAASACVRTGRDMPGFVVPTGNLGNAFACLLARERGAPIRRVMLATNANRALVALAATGRFEPARTVATLANAMDVGAASNAERLLDRFPQMRHALDADWVDDEAIREAIQATDAEHGLAICPHTACGMEVLRRLRAQGDGDTWIVAATAHAAKFDSVVEPLLGRAVPVPPALAALLAQTSHAEPLAADGVALAAALR